MGRRGERVAVDHRLAEHLAHPLIPPAGRRAPAGLVQPPSSGETATCYWRAGNYPLATEGQGKVKVKVKVKVTLDPS